MSQRLRGRLDRLERHALPLKKAFIDTPCFWGFLHGRYEPTAEERAEVEAVLRRVEATTRETVEEEMARLLAEGRRPPCGLRELPRDEAGATNGTSPIPSHQMGTD
jgi:hypothetical protein